MNGTLSQINKYWRNFFRLKADIFFKRHLGFTETNIFVRQYITVLSYAQKNVSKLLISLIHHDIVTDESQ